MKWDDWISTGAVAGGCIIGLLGGFDYALQMLITFMIIDYLSGLAVAFSGHSKKTPNGGVDSGVGFVGILKKIFILCIVVIGTMMDNATGTAVFRTVVIFFYAANEAISILENAALLGLPLPAKLLDALEQLRARADKDKPPDDTTFI